MSIIGKGVSRTAAIEINKLCTEAFAGQDAGDAVDLPNDVNNAVADVARRALTDQSRRYERQTPGVQWRDIEESRIKIDANLKGVGLLAARTVDQIAIAVQHQAAQTQAIHAQQLAVPVPSNPLTVASTQVNPAAGAPPPAPVYNDPVVAEGLELLSPPQVAGVGRAASARV